MVDWPQPFVCGYAGVITLSLGFDHVTGPSFRNLELLPTISGQELAMVQISKCGTCAYSAKKPSCGVAESKQADPT